MTQSKILVTSSVGYFGCAAVFQLIEKGYPIHAFVRRRDFSVLADSGMQLIRCAR